MHAYPPFPYRLYECVSSLTYVRLYNDLNRKNNKINIFLISIPILLGCAHIIYKKKRVKCFRFELTLY